MTKKVIDLHENYYINLGKQILSPNINFDNYRFHFIFNKLQEGNLLDIGAYNCDFLLGCKNKGINISGTEINQQRVDNANKILGGNFVTKAFINGDLSIFQDNSFDNVTCLEVLEHVPDFEFALRELCRVSRKGVYITVPFNEKIEKVLCIHCAKFTPLSGHLHSFNYDSFNQIIPVNWKIFEKIRIINTFSRIILKRSNNQSLYKFIDLIDKIPTSYSKWLYICLIAK